MFDDGVEAGAIERHPHRPQHLVRALGERAQDRMRAVIGVPERRVDEACELRVIGLQTDLRSHWNDSMRCGTWRRAVL
jgi:hypothetical protein